MSDQPTLYQFISVDYERTAIMAKAVVPVEPVGTLTVKQDGSAGFHKSLPAGKYLIVPLEADDE